MSKVLIIGSGGREHALAKQFRESPHVTEIYVAPGRCAMKDVAIPVDIPSTDFLGLIAFAKEKQIDLTFVGPEIPLTLGIVDCFQAEGLRIFGPRKNAAILEGSKSFAKDLMIKYNIPTADYQVFTEYEKACEYIESITPPIVIKADGLAEGKGVVIANNTTEAKDALMEMLEKGRFGESGRAVVIEEFLDGPEFSFMAFVHGEAVYPMVISQDHKRAFDGDKGPNTGGMGAYAPVPMISDDMVEYSYQHILVKTAKAMVAEGRSFTGILYGGLIATKNGVKVIEFNARFGDPETEVVLPLLETDLYGGLMAILDGKAPEFRWSNKEMIGVVLATKGYPGAYNKGALIKGLETLEDETYVFHCGTKETSEGFVTDGGRVLLIARKASNFQEAREKLYQEIKKIDCEELFYRGDIGGKACLN
jgi:phosphoribosylamine--glycine ligase